jgi:hypothetical protein
MIIHIRRTLLGAAVMALFFCVIKLIVWIGPAIVISVFGGVLVSYVFGYILEEVVQIKKYF